MWKTPKASDAEGIRCSIIVCTRLLDLLVCSGWQQLAELEAAPPSASQFSAKTRPQSSKCQG